MIELIVKVACDCDADEAAERVKAAIDLHHALGLISVKAVKAGSPEPDYQIIAMFNAGHKFQAIKAYRDHHPSMSLYDCVQKVKAAAALINESHKCEVCGREGADLQKVEDIHYICEGGCDGD